MNNKRIISIILAICLAVVPISGAFSANGDHITVNLTGVQTSVSLETGELYVLSLANIFNDPNSGHTVTYDVDGINGTILGPHTHIAYPEGVPTLVFTEANIGTYYVKVSASCTDHDHADFSMTFTVTLASDGTPSQYSYNETAQNSVRVYVTISNDGMPIKGNDGTIMANLPVTVDYFDLDDYGLADYYRFPTNNGGEYISNDPEDVIERPTVLHLYIQLLEQYYMDSLDDVMDFCFNDEVEVKYMDGNSAYTIGTSDKAIDIEGSATSLYLLQFWGHDCNLMYFRNHVFPLMSPGWGATCDYALLSDGDVIEIAMFTDWGFFSDGAFLRFNGYDKYASCNISRGTTFDVYTQKYSTSSMGGNGCFINTTEGLDVAIYSSNGACYGSFTRENNSSNKYSFTVPTSTDVLPSGIYYVVARDPDAESEDACMAPAVMTVVVH